MTTDAMTFIDWLQFILLLPAWIAVSSSKVEFGMFFWAIGLGTGYILTRELRK